MSSGGAPGFLVLWHRCRCIEMHCGAGKTGGAMDDHGVLVPELVLQGVQGVFGTFHP